MFIKMLYSKYERKYTWKRAKRATCEITLVVLPFDLGFYMLACFWGSCVPSLLILTLGWAVCMPSGVLALGRGASYSVFTGFAHRLT